MIRKLFVKHIIRTKRWGWGEAFLTQVADILERFSAQWLNGTVDTSMLSSVGEAAATSATPPPSALSKMAETFGELEMVLTGLNLPDMIPVFRQHQVAHWLVYLCMKNDVQCRVQLILLNCHMFEISFCTPFACLNITHEIIQNLLTVLNDLNR